MRSSRWVRARSWWSPSISTLSPGQRKSSSKPRWCVLMTGSGSRAPRISLRNRSSRPDRVPALPVLCSRERASEHRGSSVVIARASKRLLELGLVDHVRELLGHELAAHVEQDARDGADRDRVADQRLTEEQASRHDLEARLRAASLRHGDLDRRLPEARDPPEPPAAEPGERGSVTRGVHGREPFTLARELGMADRVHPAVLRVQAPGAHGAPDLVLVQAGRADHAVLAGRVGCNEVRA